MMPTVTKNLLIINVLLFFGNVVAARHGVDLNNVLGLHFFMSGDFHFHQLFTYMFMHADLSHIFFNMFGVWMLGKILEMHWGPKRYLFYYIVCGVGAGLIQELVYFINIQPLLESMPLEAIEVVKNEGPGLISQHMNYVDPKLAELNILMNGSTIGASGALFAILLAFGMLFPNEQLILIPFPFPIKAKYFVIGYALIELATGILNRPGDNVAHFAHLGGMIFGIALILYWKKKGNNYGGYTNGY